jgi:hypothetical protein
MLDKIQRQSRIVEQLAKNTMTGELKNTDDWPGNSGDDAMGVNIGDHIHYHYDETPTLKTEESTPAVATPAKASRLASAALLAAGLLGGAGVAAAVPWMLGAYENTNTNTNTTVDKTQDLGVGIEVIPGGAVE